MWFENLFCRVFYFGTRQRSLCRVFFLALGKETSLPSVFYLTLGKAFFAECFSFGSRQSPPALGKEADSGSIC
jgi:hypothetical protein